MLEIDIQRANRNPFRQNLLDVKNRIVTDGISSDQAVARLC